MICNMELSDLEAVISHAKSFFAESYYKGKFECSIEQCAEMVAALITEDSGISLIDRNTGAFFLGGVQPHWFGNYNYAYDYCIYVPPEQRGNGSGYRLLKKYTEVAEELGANEIFLGDIASIDQETLFKIHEKLGLQLRSKSYSKIVGGH